MAITLPKSFTIMPKAVITFGTADIHINKPQPIIQYTLFKRKRLNTAQDYYFMSGLKLIRVFFTTSYSLNHKFYITLSHKISTNEKHNIKYIVPISL